MNIKTPTQLQNPLKAVTHPDPYPYYRDLVQRSLYYDETLRIWVASSASRVKAVLTNDLCRVRPTAEPVPTALLNSHAADIFQHLVRMNDGQYHTALKSGVSAVLSKTDMAQFSQYCNKWAEVLFDTLAPGNNLALLSEFAFQLPVYVLGDMVGIASNQLSQVAGWIRDFVACLSPLSSTDQIKQSDAAAEHLLDLFRSLLADGPVDTLLGQLSAEASRYTSEMIIANAIGFLSQSYEATAGLITNTIVNLARHPDILEQVKADPRLLAPVIQEVLRYDPSIQNTRRFFAKDTIIAGHEMKAGDIILVVLAAANHDPLANTSPDHFDIFRNDRQLATFGMGIHTCPGQTFAAEIARIGVMQWINAGAPWSQLLQTVSYQESVNARLPIFPNLVRSDAQ